MNFMSFGGGGYAAQESDPKLGDKLAALKRKGQSSEDKLTSFLARDLGVDPATLPFTPTTAREWLLSRLEAHDGDSLTMYGTSMALQRIVVEVYDDAPVTIAEDSPDWHDAQRAHAALVKEFPEHFTFRVNRSYPDLSVEPQQPTVTHADLASYPPGSVLRIERKVPTGDQLAIERQYIRIGGLFDDTTPTILDTMQPMGDLTGWIVIEELS